MENRAEIKQAFKEQNSQIGVVKITNLENGKILIVSSRNSKAMINREQFLLKTGIHPNKKLQHDWNQQGAEHFSFEIVETVKRREDVPPTYLYQEELRELETKWMDELQPFGEKGYNV